MSGIDITAPEDLSRVVRVERNGCWSWLGYINAATGYGSGTFDGRWGYAHRGVYELLVGLIPIGQTIDHLCLQHDCTNPAHLEAVSMRVNILRSTNPMARNARKTACKWGHEFTPENTLHQVSRGTPQRICRTCASARTRRYQAKRDYGIDLPLKVFFEKTASEVREIAVTA